MSDYPTVDVGNLCVYCGADTSVSGFVNRIPADTVVSVELPCLSHKSTRFNVPRVDIRLDGYMCPDCQAQDQDDLEEACLDDAYREGGASAVWEWCEENRGEWAKSRCEPCDAITHTWERVDEDVCAVCWSAKENKEV